MTYQIVYDQPGRLRIRLGAYVLDQAQGYGLAAALRKVKGVVAVRVTPINGGILVTYAGEMRAQILAYIDGLDRRALPTGELTEDDEAAELADGYVNRFAALVGRHYLIKWFLPRTLRHGLTLFRSVGFLAAGGRALRRGQLNVDVLDASSIGAALLQGSNSTASSIMLMLGLSSLLEEYTRKSAKNALANSLAVRIDRLWCVRGEEEVLLPIGQVAIGDLVRIRSGAMIPLDGTITDGEAMINEAAMTGEAQGVFKQAGHAVYAGTIVEEGSIVFAVSALPDDTRIQKIVAMIDESESLKAGVQSRAEKLADSIVPFSFMAAGLTLLLTRSLTKAMSALMVDYSCAIKLATPIAVISAMREATEYDIMVKGGKFLESYANATAIVFDKTGTLTNACPKVAEVVPVGDYQRDEVLRIAACLEEHFPHSVARAIVAQAEEEGLKHAEEHAEVEYVVAHGIVSKLHGQTVAIGSEHFIFDDVGTLIAPETKAYLTDKAEGRSAVYLAVGGQIAGMICILDPVRDDARATVTALRAQGIARIIMLTGDGIAAARKAAEDLGITEYRAQVLPEDKAKAIEQLKSEGYQVIMVGDGINDSPALATADVSVAMKSSSDIAREVADITLLSEELENLVTLRHLSKRLLKRIDTNFGLIIGINTSLFALGVVGIITPTTTALLHNVSTMGISAASMRPYLAP